MHNMVHELWQNFSINIPQWAIDAYGSVDPWTYPFVFIGIIGYIYTATESLTMAVVGIFITFGIFATTTSIFEAVPQISTFFYIIAVLGITMLVVTLIIKKRR